MSTANSYGSGHMPHAYWGWFMHRESGIQDISRQMYGGTYLVVLCGADVPGFQVMTARGAVMDDFGNLVAVKGPQS